MHKSSGNHFGNCSNCLQEIVCDTTDFRHDMRCWGSMSSITNTKFTVKLSVFLAYRYADTSECWDRIKIVNLQKAVSHIVLFKDYSKLLMKLVESGLFNNFLFAFRFPFKCVSILFSQAICSQCVVHYSWFSFLLFQNTG